MARSHTLPVFQITNRGSGRGLDVVRLTEAAWGGSHRFLLLHVASRGLQTRGPSHAARGLSAAATVGAGGGNGVTGGPGGPGRGEKRRDTASMTCPHHSSSKSLSLPGGWRDGAGWDPKLGHSPWWSDEERRDVSSAARPLFSFLPNPDQAARLTLGEGSRKKTALPLGIKIASFLPDRSQRPEEMVSVLADLCYVCWSPLCLIAFALIIYGWKGPRLCLRDVRAPMRADVSAQL